MRKNTNKNFSGLITLNRQIYDINLELQNENNMDELLSIEIADESKIHSYKFVGGMTALIDIENNFKKFDELIEIFEILVESIKAKNLKTELTDNNFKISFETEFIKKKIVFSITLKPKETSPENEEIDLKQEIIALTKKVRELEIAVQINTRRKIQHLAVNNQKNSWHWITDGEEYSFDFEVKTSRDVEFIVCAQFSHNNAENNWLSITLEAENTSLNEKNSYLMFSHHVYANPTHTHPIVPPLNLKRVEFFIKGEYKMKVILNKSGGVNAFLLSTLFVFSKQ